MKKTVTISISGYVFHIEEDAFEKLHLYLEAIKFHFKGFEGREEVISDVEARIAEILQTKISESKEVITISDVGEVIAIMGQPSDFGGDEEPAAAGGGNAPSYSYKPKRLYRDGERKVFGGVCSGLAAYFNLDPVWVRIFFLVSVAISGFGLLLYIILWLVVPEARTTVEKLEMRGEPVNVSTIEKNFKDGVRDIEDKVRDFTSKAKSTFRKEKDEFNTRYGTRVRNGLNDTGRTILRILLIIIGIVVLFIGIALTIVYLSILFKFPVIAVLDDAGLEAFPLYSVIDRIFASDGDLRTFVTGLMILAGIPLIMMLWGGIRLIFNLPRVRMLAGLAGFAWVCALIITVIFGLKVGNSFRQTGEFARQVPIDIKSADTLYVMSNGFLPLEKGWEKSGLFYFDEARVAVMNDSQVIYGIPLLKFKLSSDSTGHINVATLARGTSTMNAIETAEMVDYKWQQTGDTLILSDNFALRSEEKWRMQKTRVEVFLPEGTCVSIANNVYPIMGYHKNISRYEKEPMGTLFVMKNEGLVRREK